MNSKQNTNILIETLKAQAELFGDELFVSLQFNDLLKSVNQKLTNIGSKDKPIESEPLISFNNTNNFSSNTQADVTIPTNMNDNNFYKANSLKELDSLINKCTKCALGKTRNKFVFGTGNPNADIMLIGEAPGADEDMQGIPFVGRAGQLLNKILEAINIKREEVYIANILKCRPPDNRTPIPAEINTCIPYLKKQIELIKPKVILCLGVTAANGLLNTKSSMIKLRGNVYEFHGVKLMVTYHPAALLRNPNWKKETWEDVQKFYNLYKSLI